MIPVCHWAAVVLFVLTLSACCTRPATPAGQAPERTEILWNTWGVPHIFAREARQLHYAFGWAQM